MFGIANGAYAEYAAADEHKLVHKPANITFQQAGVAAISGGTALQALTDVGRLEAGQRVLVVGASGGVGTYTVQLAKALGGVVTGVASTAKVDLVRSIGADDVIDYSAQDFLDGTTRYDLIIDIGGRNTIRRLRRALTPTGTLVLTGGEGGGRWTGGFLERQLRALVLSAVVGQRLKGFINKEHHTILERLADFLAQRRRRARHRSNRRPRTCSRRHPRPRRRTNRRQGGRRHPIRMRRPPDDPWNANNDGDKRLTRRGSQRAPDLPQPVGLTIDQVSQVSPRRRPGAGQRTRYQRSTNGCVDGRLRRPCVALVRYELAGWPRRVSRAR